MAIPDSYRDSFRTVIRWMKLCFTPLAILFLVYYGWHSKDSLAGLIQEAQLQWLVLSVLLWVSLHFISPVFTVLVFRGCQLDLHYRDAFVIHAGRLPAKYLPGGIWHSVARAADYHNQGYTGRQIASYLLVENIVAASITLSAGGIIVAHLPDINSLWTTTATMAAIIGGGSLLLLPVIVSRFLLPADGRLAWKPYMAGVAWSALYWLVAASSFVSFLECFPDLDLAVNRIEAGGIYLFSWGIGFIALFAPQGFGVSEFISGKLLDTEIGVGGTAALLMVFRIPVLLADFSAWMVSVPFTRQSHRAAHR